jgi:acyl-CoA synthetase (AMP-forming)/AMP-acid ligase II
MAMVTVSSTAEADKSVAAAHSACLDRFGFIFAPRIILVVPSIPMTIDGAPRRVECERLAQAFMTRNVTTK